MQSSPESLIQPAGAPVADLNSQAVRVGWVLALSSTFASSLVTPLVRGAVLGGMDPLTLLLLRLVLAVVLMAVMLGFTAPRSFRLGRSGWGRMGIIGLISGIEIGCFFSSLAYVDASTTAMVKSTQPLVVLFFLALGGERLTSRSLVRLAFSMVGIYLLVGAGSHVSPLGLFFLFLSLLLYALQLVLTQWWLAGYNARTVTVYVTTLMSLVVAVWWASTGASWSDPGPTGWLVIGALALVSTFFAKLTLYAAIRRIGSGQIALLWPVQTLAVIVLSVIFLDERLTAVQAMGGVLILVSALLAMERPRWPKPTYTT